MQRQGTRVTGGARAPGCSQSPSLHGPCTCAAKSHCGGAQLQPGQTGDRQGLPCRQHSVKVTHSRDAQSPPPPSKQRRVQSQPGCPSLPDVLPLDTGTQRKAVQHRGGCSLLFALRLNAINQGHKAACTSESPPPVRTALGQRLLTGSQARGCGDGSPRSTSEAN